MAWETLPVVSQPVLPGTIPVLQWFAAEWGHPGPPMPVEPLRYTGSMQWLDHVKWDAAGLVPVIAQEASSGERC